MQFHAYALAEAGWFVTVLAFQQSRPYPAVEGHRRIRLRPLIDLQLAQGPYLFTAAVRFIGHSLHLFYCLFFGVKRWELLFVQNPPALPTLPLCWMGNCWNNLFRREKGRFVIDWHNLGHKVLAQKLGDHALLTRSYRSLEMRFGRRAQGHLCVSNALARHLSEHGGFSTPGVCYDRPPRFLFEGPASNEPLPPPIRSLLDQVPAGARLLVTGTSWTEDEDPWLLVEAAARFDHYLQGIGEEERCRYDALSLLFTGKGKGLHAFKEKLKGHRFAFVTVQTCWLSAQDYPILLNQADWGVCLHTSASGLDLPMKLADMQGAGLPVLIYDYGPVLNERPGHVPVYLFKEVDTLFEHLRALARKDWQTVYAEAVKGRSPGAVQYWEEAWHGEAAPVLFGHDEKGPAA